MSRLKAAIRLHPFLSSAFVLALALTLLFTARTVMFTLYWADPAHRNLPIEGWMTPRYVSHSWQVPPETIQAGLHRAMPERGDRRTLADIARDSGIPLDQLIADLTAAIALRRTIHP